MLIRHLTKLFFGQVLISKHKEFLPCTTNSILEPQSSEFWKHTWCHCCQIIHGPGLGSEGRWGWGQPCASARSDTVFKVFIVIYGYFALMLT